MFSKVIRIESRKIIKIPFNSSETLPSRGMVMIEGTMNGVNLKHHWNQTAKEVTGFRQTRDLPSGFLPICNRSLAPPLLSAMPSIISAAFRTKFPSPPDTFFESRRCTFLRTLLYQEQHCCKRRNRPRNNRYGS
ncbi:MAG: hypothetical protein K0R05_1975 [Anaerocolumna sp.]|jgi:hypothetical protein|nr:hypothetical protein [Anaerocolumna sp.]